MVSCELGLFLYIFFTFILGVVIGFFIALQWRKKQTEIILKARDEMMDEFKDMKK